MTESNHKGLGAHYHHGKTDDLLIVPSDSTTKDIIRQRLKL